MKLRILNDIHAGVNRGAGTTPVTQLLLRQYIIDKFAQLLPDNEDVMILGDLFDTGAVPVGDVLKVYIVIADWLRTHPNQKLYNVMGNHDASKSSNVLSSFQFLGKILVRSFPEQYVHIEDPVMTPWGYVIPHLVNQDLFNLALTRVPECRVVYLHCNYDNNFAAQADQSLNLSAEQAAALPCDYILIAHEHHPRTAGKVIIPGNQIASSVADWQQTSDRFYTTINEDWVVTKHVSQQRALEYTEMPYSATEVTNHRFVKVTGNVAPEEFNKAVTALNRLRAKHDAFVIANGIKTISSDNIEVIQDSLANVQNFDVWASLEKFMLPEEMATLREINKLD